LRLSEKELPERLSGSFGNKNVPGHRLIAIFRQDLVLVSLKVNKKYGDPQLRNFSSEFIQVQ
jgi:hypothetical protein